MKRILILITASFLFLACSKNDDKPEQENGLKIKKLSKTFYREDGTSYRLDYLYNLAGQRIKWIQDNADENSLFHEDYQYNAQGQILESKTTNINENRVTRTISYIYDSSNRIATITNKSWDGSIYSTYLTYENDTVFVNNDLGGNKKLIFSEDGKLKETISEDYLSFTGIVTETINYSDNSITSIHYEYSSSSVSTEDYIYEYDERTNPLFENFNNNINNFLYNFNGNMKSFKTEFSANNFSKVKFTSSLPDPNLNYIDVFTTQYNEQNFPVSSEVKRNGVLFEELTYEYY